MLGGALRLPAKLARKPRDQPDRGSRGLGRVTRVCVDGDRIDSIQFLAVAGGIEELCDQLAPSGQAEPDAIAAARAEGRVETEAKRTGIGAGVGQVENEARTGAGQVTKERLVLSGVTGPPQEVRQVRLEQRPDCTGKEVDGVRSGLQDDPFRADLRQPRRRQVAKRGDFGGDLASGIVRPAEQNGTAREPAP